MSKKPRTREWVACWHCAGGKTKRYIILARLRRKEDRKPQP